MRPSKRWLGICIAYVGLVACLTVTWSDPSRATGFSATEAVTFVITLPISGATLPLTYLVLAIARNLVGADNAVPSSTITLIYAWWFACLAVANLVLLGVVTHLVRDFRENRQSRLARAASEAVRSGTSGET
jgi:hypothetical protein